MDRATRQSVLDSIEAEFRPPNFFFSEQGEFARFDVSVTYLSGDCGLTVQRCAEHIADARSALESPGKGPQLLAIDVPGPCTEAQAQEALRQFFRHLFTSS